MEIKQVDLDTSGIHKWSQNKNVLSPKYSCFTTNLIQAYEILLDDEACFEYLKNYHSEYKRVTDKFLYFMRNEKCMLELFKLYYPVEYNNWINDKKKDKDLYSEKYINPNEIFKLCVLGFNLFLSINQIDKYISICKLTYADIKSIKEYLYCGKPVIASFTFGKIKGHIMTIKGFTDNGFLVYDTFNCSDLNKYTTVCNAKLIPYKDFEKMCKPINGNKKHIIVIG